MKEFVHHYRILDGQMFAQRLLREHGLTRYVNPRGGLTVVEFVDDLGEQLALGEAFCSDLDNYSKKRGRQIARGRALKAAGLA